MKRIVHTCRHFAQRRVPARLPLIVLDVLDAWEKGARNADLAKSSLRNTASGWIRFARRQKCAHQRLLPVEALIRKWGDLHVFEFALQNQRSTECGARDARHSMVCLCEPGCLRQRVGTPVL